MHVQMTDMMSADYIQLTFSVHRLTILQTFSKQKKKGTWVIAEAWLDAADIYSYWQIKQNANGGEKNIWSIYV